MKTYISALSLIVALSACTSQTATYSPENKIAAKDFIFHAEHISITDPDVTNILSQGAGGSAAQMSNLSAGYILKVENHKLICDLPYFGRLYNASFDTSKNGLHFTSDNFTAEAFTGKKGKIIYEIKPNDAPNIRRISVEMYPKGKAYLTVDAADRQPASYDGYISYDFK